MTFTACSARSASRATPSRRRWSGAAARRLPSPPRSRRPLATLLVALLLCLASASVAGAEIRTFRSPTGKLGCLYESGPRASVRCDWAGGGTRAVVVRRTGKGRFVRVGDTVRDPRAPVLRYGTSRRYGRFRCTSRRSGITCENARGHGFTVSVERRRLY
jgi:hypothetical protein